MGNTDRKKETEELASNACALPGLFFDLLLFYLFSVSPTQYHEVLFLICNCLQAVNKKIVLTINPHTSQFKQEGGRVPPFEFIEGLRNCVLLTFIRHNENKDIYADEINALGMTNQRKINNNDKIIQAKDLARYP